jgi:hypothetical protein
VAEVRNGDVGEFEGFGEQLDGVLAGVHAGASFEHADRLRTDPGQLSESGLGQTGRPPVLPQ